MRNGVIQARGCCPHGKGTHWHSEPCRVGQLSTGMAKGLCRIRTFCSRDPTRQAVSYSPGRETEAGRLLGLREQGKVAVGLSQLHQDYWAIEKVTCLPSMKPLCRPLPWDWDHNPFSRWGG